MASVSDATSRMQESFDMERAQSRESNERNRKEKAEEYEERLKEQNAEYNQRLQRIRQEAQEDIQKLKGDLYDKNGKSSNREAQALQEEKNRLNQYREDLERDADKRVNRIENLARERSAKTDQNENHKIEKALDSQKQSHLEEITRLEAELSQYRHSGRDVERDRAAAKQGAIQEYEGEKLKERDRIVEAYERAIENLHTKQDEMGEHYSRRLTESTFEANEKAETQVRNQKNEFAKIDRDRMQQIHRMEDQFNQEINNEKRRNDRSTGTLILQSQTDKEKAILDKDATYKAYLNENRMRQEYELSEAKDEAKMLRTTSDSTKVSPYVVDKIQKNAETRYHAQLEESNNIHQRNLDATRQRDGEDRRALQEGYNESITRVARDSQRGQDVEKKQFLAAYTDLQKMRDDDNRTNKQLMSDTTLRTQQRNALDGELSERRHRDALLAQRDELRDGQTRSQDELEMKYKEESRGWSVKYNDMRRNYQKQLNEQRDQNELKTAEMKFEFDKKLRDNERKANRALEDRVKMYEHLMKQQELAFKEKERFLTERYEEEVDRMKLTNARLVQKKS